MVLEWVIVTWVWDIIRHLTVVTTLGTDMVGTLGTHLTMVIRIITTAAAIGRDTTTDTPMVTTTDTTIEMHIITEQGLVHIIEDALTESEVLQAQQHRVDHHLLLGTQEQLLLEHLLEAQQYTILEAQALLVLRHHKTAVLVRLAEAL